VSTGPYRVSIEWSCVLRVSQVVSQVKISGTPDLNAGEMEKFAWTNTQEVQPEVHVNRSGYQGLGVGMLRDKLYLAAGTRRKGASGAFQNVIKRSSLTAE
jgi:hypothetical protein